MKSDDKIFISIIIPAFNEASRIGETLESISSYLKSKKFSHEVIVVDDGSDDTTSAVACDRKHLFNDFRLLRNEINEGKGCAVRRGMRAARGDFRLFMDADNSVTIQSLDAFLELMGRGADIVVGSIDMKGSMYADDNFRYRMFLRKVAKFLIWLIARPGVRDTQRGFKLFSAKAAETTFGRQTICGWGFDIEIIVIARAQSLKVAELPVNWMNKKTTSLTFFSYIRTFRELIRIKINLLKGRYR